MSKFHRMLSLAVLGFGMVTALSLSPAAHAASASSNPCPDFIKKFAKTMNDQYKVFWVITPDDLPQGGANELTFVRATKNSHTKPAVGDGEFYVWQKTIEAAPQFKVAGAPPPPSVKELDRNLRRYGGVFIVTYPTGTPQGNLYVPVFNGTPECHPAGAVDLSNDDQPLTQ